MERKCSQTAILLRLIIVDQRVHFINNNIELFIVIAKNLLELSATSVLGDVESIMCEINKICVHVIDYLGNDSNSSQFLMDLQNSLSKTLDLFLSVTAAFRLNISIEIGRICYKLVMDCILKFYDIIYHLSIEILVQAVIAGILAKKLGLYIYDFSKSNDSLLNMVYNIENLTNQSLIAVEKFSHKMNVIRNKCGNL
tara:strand:+ start:367 stop:957 length:591 start_codon:yes stop_codon:yes gene_type:complete